MNCCNMLIQVALLRKSVVTNVTFEWLIFFMNWRNMLFQVAFYWTAVVTNVTDEWLFSFMNNCHMLFQVAFSWTIIVADVTFEWLLYCMNWCNMFIQVTLSRKAVITNSTFKWSVSLMNCTDMLSQFFLLVKVLSHISHLNVFFSWLDEIFVSNLLFILKFDLNDFYPMVSSWTKFQFCFTYHTGCQIRRWISNCYCYENFQNEQITQLIITYTADAEWAFFTIFWLFPG